MHHSTLSVSKGKIGQYWNRNGIQVFKDVYKKMRNTDPEKLTMKYNPFLSHV